MIIVKQGNALDVPHGIIVHGCNSHGVMNSGIAKEVRARWPGAFDVYRNEYDRCIANGLPGLPLGSFTVHYISATKAIVNAVTQENYGRDPNVVYVDYKALGKVFEKLGDTLMPSLYAPIAEEFGLNFPKIGCGLANGDWSIVSQLIDGLIPDHIEKTYWEFSA